MFAHHEYIFTRTGIGRISTETQTDGRTYTTFVPFKFNEL
jgi:hypothetical protein